MKFPVVALFVRALRLDARALSTYSARALLIGIILITLMTAQASSMVLSAPGLTFFTQTVYVNLVIVTLLGLAYFSAAITEEKEEMTLGLLLMTGLRPLAILLGKSVSRLAAALLLIVAQVPFTLLAVTLGGVSQQQVLAAYAAILAYTVLLSNLGLLSSVLCSTGRVATSLASLLLFAFIMVPIVGLPSLDGLVAIGRIDASSWPTLLLTGVFQWMRDANPFRCISGVLATGFNEAIISFQVLSNVALGIACFALARLFFPLCTRQQKSSGPTRAAVATRASRLRALAPSRAWRRAVVWKDFYFMTGGKFMIGFKLALLFAVALFVGGFIYKIEGLSYASQPDMRDVANATGSTMMILALMIAAVELAVQAGRVFKVEVQWQTLSTLLQVPASTRRIAAGKFVGCLAGLSPYAIYFIAGAILAPEPFFDVLDDFMRELMRDTEAIFVLVYMTSVTVLFYYLTTYLSLVVKWGAMFLAMVVLSVGNTMVTGMFALMFARSGLDEGIFVLACLAMIGFSIALHAMIIARLEKLAGQS